jgi:serine/threonine-protein kinase
MLKVLLREVALFVVCAVFVGTVLLFLLDKVIMPYVVRKGRLVEVPDIVDLASAQARRTLARYGLQLELQKPRWDESVFEGRVVYQNPTAFSMVKPGRTVYAVPSLGTRLYEVPDLRKRSLRQARLWIEQGGLGVGEVSEEASLELKEGLVIRQAPSAGQKMPADTPVSLVVSSGPPREVVGVPNVVGRPLDDARSGLASLELQATIRYEFSTAYLPNTVIRQVPEAGEKVKQGTAVQLVVSKL